LTKIINWKRNFFLDNNVNIQTKDDTKIPKEYMIDFYKPMRATGGIHQQTSIYSRDKVKTLLG